MRGWTPAEKKGKQCRDGSISISLQKTGDFKYIYRTKQSTLKKKWSTCLGSVVNEKPQFIGILVRGEGINR